MPVTAICGCTSWAGQWRGRRLQTNVEFYTALLLYGLGLEAPLSIALPRARDPATVAVCRCNFGRGPPYASFGVVVMFTLMTLFALFFVAMCGLMLMAFVALALKCALKLVLLPIKLLFLPILLIALVVKFAVILAVGAVLLAVVIPIAILALLFVGPFLLLASLT